MPIVMIIKTCSVQCYTDKTSFTINTIMCVSGQINVFMIHKSDYNFGIKWAMNFIQKITLFLIVRPFYLIPAVILLDKIIDG